MIIIIQKEQFDNKFADMLLNIVEHYIKVFNHSFCEGIISYNRITKIYLLLFEKF